VARQFGLIQTRPRSLYKCKEDLKKSKTESQWRSLFQNFNESIPNFKLSYDCTKSFFKWWQGYFVEKSKQVNPNTLLPELISDFNYVQKNRRNPNVLELDWKSQLAG